MENLEPLHTHAEISHMDPRVVWGVESCSEEESDLQWGRYDNRSYHRYLDPQLIVPTMVLTVRDGCTRYDAFSDGEKVYAISGWNNKAMKEMLGFNVIVEPSHCYPYNTWTIKRHSQLF